MSKLSETIDTFCLNIKIESNQVQGKLLNDEMMEVIKTINKYTYKNFDECLHDLLTYPVQVMIMTLLSRVSMLNYILQSSIGTSMEQEILNKVFNEQLQSLIAYANYHASVLRGNKKDINEGSK